MKTFIKKLLKESLESLDSNLENDPLYIEGKKFYPNLKIKIIGTHYDPTPKPRFFINPRKNKGSFTYNSFKNKLTTDKIIKTFNWLRDKGKVYDIKSSISTNSIYFVFNGKQVRISDHPKENSEFSIIIKWDTQSSEIIEQLNTLLNYKRA